MKFHILIPQEIWIDDDDVAKLCKRIKDRYEKDAFDDDPPIEELFADEVLEEAEEDGLIELPWDREWHIDYEKMGNSGRIRLDKLDLDEWDEDED